MKKLYKYIVFVIGILAFSACTDDVEFPNVEVEEGTDVTLKLNIKTETNQKLVVSRATETENKLYDVHFYVFNTKGNDGGELIGYEKLVFDGYIPPTLQNGNTVPQSISIRAKTGEVYIYAVANINNGANYSLTEGNSNLLNVTQGATINNTTFQPIEYTEGEGTETKDLKQLVEESGLTRNAFLGIKYQREYTTDENNMKSPTPSTNTFVMSGYLNDGNVVTIEKVNNVVSISGNNDSDGNIIKLYRILAKNTLEITYNEANGTFTPKYYRLQNVPTKGILIPKSGIGTTRNLTTYNQNGYIFSDGVQTNITEITDNAEIIKTSGFRANFEGNNKITFFYPENLQVAKTGEGVKTTAWEWEDREKNSWNLAGTEKTFDHADDKASYIEIYGDYKSKSGKVTANVTYTIHLGNFSNSGNYKDFNVVRNFNYIYKVHINDVKDVQAEAEIENRDNPYVEGIVIDASQGEHYDVDAHYEARVMTFTKSSIDALKTQNKGYILNVKTPFGSTSETVNVKADGVYKMNSTTPFCSIADAANIFDGEADYEWMKFVKNTTGNKIATVADANISNYPCKYPGDTSRYNSSSNTGGWLNVFELLAELYDTTSENNVYTHKITVNGKTDYAAYYTCFIDENYYYDRTWPEFVDQEPRTMQIANNLSVSDDGKSLYADVRYSISQRSICTFYQTDYMYPEGDTPDDLVIAFGTEIIDEEDDFNSRISNRGTIDEEDWNAYTSAFNTTNGQPWYPTNQNANNAKLVSGIQPLYTTAAKACMSRNRDLNGDNNITYNANDPSKNEVRWYLAGVEQYRALFYGATPTGLRQEDAYLISKNELNALAESLGYNNTSNEARAPYHYYTCSDGVKKIFWAEEGLTNNNTETWSKAELVRCIRTLESGSEGQKKYGVRDPEPFYDFKDMIFDLGGIVLTRNHDGGMPLANHNEQTYPNNLFSSFEVARNDLEDVDEEFNYSSSHRNDEKYYFDLRAVTGSQNSPGERLSGDYSTYTKDYCQNYAQDTDRSDLGTWRTPNQKELALMASEISAMSDYNYGTRTRFSGWDHLSSTYPDAWNWPYGNWSWHGDCWGIWSEADDSGARINLGYQGSENGVRIRCVRDVRL